MKRYYVIVALFFMNALILACTNPQEGILHKKENTTCCIKTPSRFAAAIATSATIIAHSVDSTTVGMVFIRGGSFMMGGDNKQAASDEYPKLAVKVDSFWMDATEVTNAQYEAFVKATGYI